MNDTWERNKVIASGTIGPASWAVQTGCWPGWYHWTAQRKGREDRKFGWATPDLEEALLQASSLMIESDLTSDYESAPLVTVDA